MVFSFFIKWTFLKALRRAESVGFKCQIGSANPQQSDSLLQKTGEILQSFV